MLTATNRKALAGPRTPCDIGAMLNIASILIGIIALILAIPAFIPFLGRAPWLVIPIAVVGLELGAMSDRHAGRYLNIALIVDRKSHLLGTTLSVRVELGGRRLIK